MADITPLVSLNGELASAASLNGELAMPEKVWMQGPPGPKGDKGDKGDPGIDLTDESRAAFKQDILDTVWAWRTADTSGAVTVNSNSIAATDTNGNVSIGESDHLTATDDGSGNIILTLN